MYFTWVVFLKAYLFFIAAFRLLTATAEKNALFLRPTVHAPFCKGGEF
ncbi:MAG: hypothetical protein LBP51_03285 [Deferribacteraceae bacterium]|nr:hypothetical protein [Deferribacteraceae bacterium]